MAKRRIIATAKNDLIEITLSTFISTDGVLLKSEQDREVNRFKNGLYNLLANHGFHYEEIKIK
jgi:hypothetical protein